MNESELVEKLAALEARLKLQDQERGRCQNCTGHRDPWVRESVVIELRSKLEEANRAIDRWLAWYRNDAPDNYAEGHAAWEDMVRVLSGISSGSEKKVSREREFMDAHYQQPAPPTKPAKFCECGKDADHEPPCYAPAKPAKENA